MRHAIFLLILSISISVLVADEVAKRPEVGDFIPSYASTKCGGIQDSVKIGKSVCYTCRAGDEPVFFVFAKQNNDSIAKLSKEINSLVAAHQELKTTGVVNFLGDPKDEKAREEVAQFGQKQELNHVSLTITADGSKFGLDNEAETTVFLFDHGIIRLRNSYKAGELNDQAIRALASRAKEFLK